MARKKWNDIRRDHGPDGEARIKRMKDEIALEMTLRDIREHVSDLNQTELGELLKVSQVAVSQLERRQDAVLSNISRYLAALGGQLELHAIFATETIRITQFDDVKGQIEVATKRLVPAAG
jgi:hypothetical protein